MPSTATDAPAIIRPSVRQHSFTIEYSTPNIGAEIGNISLADAAQDSDLIAEIRSLWLKHKVLFFRDQFISPMEHQNFAAQFGSLEAHPIAPSHPEADKLLMLYRNLDADKPNAVEKISRENLWHSDVTFMKAAPRGAVLRQEEGPSTGGDTIWSNTVIAYANLPEAHHLMSYLISQTAIPEYQVRLKWRPGTVAMWDNLLCQHYAVADYGQAPLKMLRATLTGTSLG